VSYIERADNRHRVHQHQPGAPLSISPKCLSDDAAPGDRAAVGTGDREIALFLLPMVAAILGDWLWTKYHASDFAAQRSVSSTEKRIKRLEEWLSNFETIYADPKRYINVGDCNQ
jgi:hypothetical protein